MKLLSRVELFVTPWTVAYQAPPSMGFSRQEYWNGLPFPSPADLPDSGIEPGFPALEADALTSEPPGKTEDTVLSVIHKLTNGNKHLPSTTSTEWIDKYELFHHSPLPLSWERPLSPLLSHSCYFLKASLPLKSPL